MPAFSAALEARYAYDPPDVLSSSDPICAEQSSIFLCSPSLELLRRRSSLRPCLSSLSCIVAETCTVARPLHLVSAVVQLSFQICVHLGRHVGHY